MPNGSINKGRKKGRERKEPIREKDLQGFKYLRDFFPLLERFHSVREHHNIDFHFDKYIALLLVYFFNPVLTSLRGIQQASHLKKVKKEPPIESIGGIR